MIQVFEIQTTSRATVVESLKEVLYEASYFEDTPPISRAADAGYSSTVEFLIDEGIQLYSYVECKTFPFGAYMWGSIIEWVMSSIHENVRDYADFSYEIYLLHGYTLVIVNS